MTHRSALRSTGVLLLLFYVPLLTEAQDLAGCEVRELIRLRPAAGLTDSVFSLLRPDGSLLYYDVHRIQRTCIDRMGRLQQALLVTYGPRSGETATLPFTGRLILAHVDVGSPGPPLQLDLLPAREVICSGGERSRWLVGAAPFAAFAGKDTSRRAIGTGSSFIYGGRVYGGVEVGGGVDLIGAVEGAMDTNRLRIPVLAAVRWTPFGPNLVEASCTYLPSDCQFGDAAAPATSACGACDFADSVAQADQSVCLQLDRRLVDQNLRPYVYAEGGIVFNGDFEGAGPSPAINEGDYGQYIAGAGVGVRMFGLLNASLGYRYWRLNVRTLCGSETGDFYVLNTNVIHSLIASVGAEF